MALVASETSETKSPPLTLAVVKPVPPFKVARGCVVAAKESNRRDLLATGGVAASELWQPRQE
jgi:hypothetical protein